MSFWTTIEADVTKGLEIAGAIVGIVPQASFLGPILEEIAEIFSAVETVTGVPASSLPAAVSSQLVQSAAMAATIKSAAAKKTT
jgi:hypothetical protein